MTLSKTFDSSDIQNLIYIMTKAEPTSSFAVPTAETFCYQLISDLTGPDFFPINVLQTIMV